MSEPPPSRVALGFYILTAVLAAAAIFSFVIFVQTPGSHIASSAKAAAAAASVRTAILAITTGLFGRVVQMIADIRWKLFRGDLDA